MNNGTPRIASMNSTQSHAAVHTNFVLESSRMLSARQVCLPCFTVSVFSHEAELGRNLYDLTELCPDGNCEINKPCAPFRSLVMHCNSRNRVIAMLTIISIDRMYALSWVSMPGQARGTSQWKDALPKSENPLRTQWISCTRRTHTLKLCFNVAYA